MGKKKPEIKIKVHRRKRYIPQQFKIFIKYNNRTHYATMDCKPDVPTDRVQTVLRSILTMLDKHYPEEPEKRPYYVI